MRLGLSARFANTECFDTNDWVFELLDVIHALRKVDTAEEDCLHQERRQEVLQQAALAAAQQLTMLVVHVHESVRDE